MPRWTPADTPDGDTADCIGGEGVFDGERPVGLTTSGGYGFTVEQSLAFEIATDSVTSIMAKANNPRALGAALLRAVDSPELRETVALNAQARCHQMFRLDDAAHRIANLYQLLGAVPTGVRLVDRK